MKACKRPLAHCLTLAAAFLLVAPQGVRAQATGKINDTGLTACATASSNAVACAWVDPSEPTAFPRQDPEFGRAAKEDAGALTIAGSDANSKGFDFQRLRFDTGANYTTTPAVLGTGTNWGCTKDNTTGLVWDMKVTTASNARLATNTYNWKNSTGASNGGSTGTTGTASGTTCFSSTCDTEAYIAYTNATARPCGFTDWRLPTRAELLGIVNAVNQGGIVDSSSAAVDSAYFPNIQRGNYWTADNVAGNPNDARTVHMAIGSDGVAPKSRKNYVILVRPGSATGTAPTGSNNCAVRSGNLATTPLTDFTDHGDGTITHNKTNLMWKRCIQGRTWSAGACTGQTLFLSWQNALKAAATDATKNVADWRLPSRNELMSIVETGCSTPMINSAIFPNIPAAGQFWTSTHAGQIAPTSAWAIRFDTGSALLKSKSQSGYALLVRKGDVHDEYWRNPPPTPDTTPDGFSFTDQTGVARSTLTESNTITITGITVATPISVTGGEYRIGAGAWASTAGNINNNSTVTVRHTSSASFNTAVNTTLTVGGVSDTFTTTTEALDTTPDAFTFVDQTGVTRSTTITSAPITVSGINSAASISVSGGSYSIGCTATFVTAAGSINNNQTVCVRHTSSPNYLINVSTTLTIGGVSDVFTSTTEPDPASDTTPDPFTFTDQGGVALNSQITSNTLTITGLTGAASISVTGGSYSIGCGTFTSTPGTITNNQTVCVRHTSAATGSTATDTVLTIGGVVDTFTSTTGDTTPDAFFFVDQGPVALNTPITSAAISVGGITLPSPISVTGGTYSINGGAFTSGAGTVVNGDSVRVQHTSANAELTPTNTVLTVGGVADTFTSTTGDQTPDAFTFVDQTGVALNSPITSAPISVFGITVASPISVSGGTYSINGGAFTSAAGTVINGDSVRVQHTSSSGNLTPTDTSLTIGGVSDVFTSTTMPSCSLSDWTPVAYSNTSGSKTANFTHPTVVTLTNVCGGTSITISSVATGGRGGSSGRIRYSINGGAQTTAAGTLQPGDVLRLHFAQENKDDTYVGTITIGGVARTWQHQCN